jgi:hypothetical protein
MSTCTRGQSRAIKGNQGQSRAIKGNQGQSRAIKGNQGQSRAIEGHQAPSGAISLVGSSSEVQHRVHGIQHSAQQADRVTYE